MVISDPTGGMGSGPPDWPLFSMGVCVFLWGFWCENIFQIPFGTQNLGENPFPFGFCFGGGACPPGWIKFLVKQKGTSKERGRRHKQACPPVHHGQQQHSAVWMAMAVIGVLEVAHSHLIDQIANHQSNKTKDESEKEKGQ